MYNGHNAKVQCNHQNNLNSCSQMFWFYILNESTFDEVRLEEIFVLSIILFIIFITCSWPTEVGNLIFVSEWTLHTINRRNQRSITGIEQRKQYSSTNEKLTLSKQASKVTF